MFMASCRAKQRFCSVQSMRGRKKNNTPKRNSKGNDYFTYTVPTSQRKNKSESLMLYMKTETGNGSCSIR